MFYIEKLYKTQVLRVINYKHLKELYTEAYKDEPFMTYIDRWDRPTTKQVVNTNYCQVSVRIYICT